MRADNIMAVICCVQGRGNSVVECRTRNRESPSLNPPFATVSKFGHFRSLHDATVHSAV